VNEQKVAGNSDNAWIVNFNNGNVNNNNKDNTNYVRPVRSSERLLRCPIFSRLRIFIRLISIVVRTSVIP
jgi:hypothetical protein